MCAWAKVRGKGVSLLLQARRQVRVPPSHPTYRAISGHVCVGQSARERGVPAGAGAQASACAALTPHIAQEAAMCAGAKVRGKGVSLLGQARRQACMRQPSLRRARVLGRGGRGLMMMHPSAEEQKDAPVGWDSGLGRLQQQQQQLYCVQRHAHQVHTGGSVSVAAHMMRCCTGRQPYGAAPLPPLQSMRSGICSCT